MPHLHDDFENAEAGELTSQLFEEVASVAFGHQVSLQPDDSLRSPTDSQFSSADRFTSLVHSPVSPAYKSTGSSTRSSLARHLDDVGDKPKSPAHLNDSKDDQDGGELPPDSATQRQSSRRQTKPTRKVSSPVKRELRARGRVSTRGAVRKAGRPAKTVPAKAVPAQRRGRPARKVKESKATVGAKGGRKEWEVEKIVDSRIEEESLEHFFRVKWKGFSDKDNTWEPKKNLANCKGLVDAYEKKAGKR